MCFAVACLIAVVSFGASLGRLVDQPARYGVTYRFGFGVGEDALSPTLRHRIERDPDIAALTYYSLTTGEAQGRPLSVAGYALARGHLPPIAIEGRLPVADDEIALGRLTARSLHAEQGGTVVVTLGGHPHAFRLTGLVMVPSLAGNDGVGEDALLPLRTLRRLDPDAQVANAVATVRPGAPAGTEARVWRRAYGLPPDAPVDDRFERPAQIANLVRVRSIPTLLAAVLALLALVSTAHVAWSSVARRRHEAAILRSLGADHRFVARTVHWQATALTFVPVLVGIPLGLAVGVRGFRAFADSVGVVHAAVVPVVGSLVVVATALVVANLAAWPAARRLRGPAAIRRD